MDPVLTRLAAGTWFNPVENLNTCGPFMNTDGRDVSLSHCSVYNSLCKLRVICESRWLTYRITLVQFVCRNQLNVHVSTLRFSPSLYQFLQNLNKINIIALASSLGSQLFSPSVCFTTIKSRVLLIAACFCQSFCWLLLVLPIILLPSVAIGCLQHLSNYSS